MEKVLSFIDWDYGGIFMILLGVYEKAMPNGMTLEEKLKEAKEAGFDFLEISMDETDEKLERLDWDWAQKKHLVDAIFENKMPIKTMCLSGNRKYPLGSNDEELERIGIKVMKKAIDFANDIGIRIIQIAGYDVYYEQTSELTVERFGRNLKLCVDYAAKKGIYLGFETMETEFMNTIKKAMNYVTWINSPYLNVYPDLGNITNAAIQYGTEVSEDILSGSGRIIAAHLKETVPGKFREIPYGNGHVDFAAAIQLFKQLGVHIYTAEFWYNGKDDWRQELINANQFLRDQF